MNAPEETAARQQALKALHARLESCRLCPRMQGPAVHGESVLSPVMLIGQAPGTREIVERRPFCWTAGKTLFKWFAPLGLDERAFRARVLMSAVCRCFPGKNPKGGDRLPDDEEVERCQRWWRGELELLRPRLILPVGRLAIAQLLPAARLSELIGRQWTYRAPQGWGADVIPLPHPSGASTWFKMEPGRTLLQQALALIAAHPAWQSLVAEAARDAPGDLPQPHAAASARTSN